MKPVGPSLVGAPVRAASELDPTRWILDAGFTPGVAVIESPLSSAFSAQGHGVATLRVDPGVEFLLTPYNPPWRLGDATDEHEKPAAISVEEGVRLSRARARFAGSAGIVRGEGQELFL